MRQEKPLPKEESFKEFSENQLRRNDAGVNQKRTFSDKPDRRVSRGNSFKEDRMQDNSGPREMFDAVCSKCKKPCKVPFKPTSGKPVSCSDCFVKRDSPSGGNFRGGGRTDSRQRSSFGGRDNNRSFGGRDSGPREMFDTVCSKCKKPCKVPFKPTSGKPVSCSDCFVKRDSPSGGNFRGGGRSSFGGRDNRSSGARDGRSSGGERRPANRGRR